MLIQDIVPRAKMRQSQMHKVRPCATCGMPTSQQRGKPISIVSA